jgi:hypothetical protein
VSARAAAVALLAAAGCAHPAAQGRGITLVEADTVVSASSGLIAQAADLAVDERGRVYVLDAMYSRVLVVPPGGAPYTLGRRGEGPGELAVPAALAVGTDSIRVADRGNGRVVVLTRAGRQARAFPIPPDAQGADVGLAAGGWAAFATYGIRDSSLARVTAPDGRPGAALGRAVGGGSGVWDFTAMKREIRRGRVPAELRNRALPVPDEEGGAWLVFPATAAVQRYDRAGRLLWERRVDAPEIVRARREFFRVNRRLEGFAAAFQPLAQVADATAAGGRLWLLLEGGDAGAAVLLVLPADGGAPLRVDVPRVAGARQVAVDAVAGRIYLALSSAEVVSVRLPPAGGGRQD